MSEVERTPEAEIEHLKLELVQAHEQFDMFFNHFLDAILVVDASSGRIARANDSAVRFFLYPRDELLCSDFRMLFPKEKAADEGHLVGSLRVHGHAFHAQTFLRSDGITVVADLSAAMVMWQGHESILIILRDASERKSFEERMLQTVEMPTGRLAAEIAEPLVPCKGNAVLVVDDQPSIRGLIKKVVQRGLPMVNIDAVASGVEALAQFKETHHELIVMDVNMPEMRGDEVFLRITEVCQKRKWAAPSVVFCTGHNSPATVRATVETNPRHLCLLKPVDMGCIVDAVRERITG